LKNDQRGFKHNQFLVFQIAFFLTRFEPDNLMLMFLRLPKESGHAKNVEIL